MRTGPKLEVCCWCRSQIEIILLRNDCPCRQRTVQGIVSKFHSLHEQQQLTMHFKYAEILVIVLHQNMKLGNNTRNNDRLS